MLKTTLASLSLAGLLFAAPVFAANVAPKPPVAATTPAPPVVTDDAKKAKSKACSLEADKKGLHGKPRKKFREECKKAA